MANQVELKFQKEISPETPRSLNLPGTAKNSLTFNNLCGNNLQEFYLFDDGIVVLIETNIETGKGIVKASVNFSISADGITF